jgi:predicted AAA+ superfamily ATPase
MAMLGDARRIAPAGRCRLERVRSEGDDGGNRTRIKPPGLDNGVDDSRMSGVMETRDRFLRDPRQSFFLFGPRGTGKSTWLRRRFPDAVWVDLLDPELQRSLAARPERLREIIEGEPSRKTVVIDEVQRAPALLDVVHGFVESRQRLRFVSAGSTARKLRHGAANLLAGCLIECRMHPFMAAELGAAFDLSRALTLGMIPLVLASSNPEATLRSYAAL